jgi:LysM repeat protein
MAEETHTPHVPAKDANSKEANDKLPKKGMLTGKNKWYVVGGLAIIAVLVFFFVRKSNSAGTGASTSATGATIDPATGFPYGSAQDQATLAAQSASGGVASSQGAQGDTGPAGATGPTGATGATGPAGNTTTTSSNGGGGTTSKPTGTASSSYVVKAGDTLASIAARFGISVATLAHANTYVSGEVPGNKKVGQTLGTGAGLKTGQNLKIPNVPAAK